jgi:(methylthio)acryloyl-CoA hydratase
MLDNNRTISVDVDGAVATLAFCRPEKRNAINDATLDALGRFFDSPPEGVRAVILRGEGGNFSAGLDLSEAVERDGAAVFDHSRGWHAVMEKIQFGGLPVVSVLDGAVMGGGLEVACATHVRVAEEGVKFQLPEGKRGIFVGGGATARIGRIIGADRMTEMMLTGRIYGAAEAVALGLAHYHVVAGEGFAKAMALAQAVASNSSLINRMVIQGLSRISDMSRADGLFTESLIASLCQTGPDAREGLTAFLEKRRPSFS